MKNQDDVKTSLGLDYNIEGALSYLFGFLSGIILLLLEKNSSFVRFHAMQSTIVFLGLYVLTAIFSIIPFIGNLIANVIQLVILAAWIIGMVKAYQREYFKFPIVGDFAESQLHKV
ncbi:MAG: DUF4870 domain-containing protein [Methanohalobium sp.]|uniref:DUF4870 domain-containing protein n=1 Tax=Methanohalobium sp. TaxID=2837493 RepID=UPI00397CDA28